MEILGVKTGVVFGAYPYGETLGLEFMEVPLLIGINWTLIILGSIALVERIIQRILPVMILTALVTVLFDYYIMEPVAISLDYWSWEEGPIPLQNYLAWGLISFVFTGVYKGHGYLQPLSASISHPHHSGAVFPWSAHLPLGVTPKGNTPRQQERLR